MKKILGISLVAVLTAMPMMANARDLRPEELAHGTIAAGDNAVLATKSYVKGAYTEVAERVNDKQDQLMAGENEINTAVVQAANIAGTVADASDTALATEKAVLTAVKAAQQAATYDDTLLTGRVSGLEGKMGNTTLTQDLSATTVTDAINELSSEKVDQEGNFTDQTNDSALIYNKTVVNAIKDTAAQVSTNTGTIGNTSFTGGTLTNAIHELQETAGGLGTNYQARSDSNVTTPGAYIQTGTGVAANLGILDTQVKTINDKGIDIVSDWATGTVSQIKVANLPTYTGTGE